MYQDFAIFLGTFSPIHHGHISIALQACEQCRLAGIRYILSPNPPNKTQNPPMPWQYRQAMLEASLEEYANLTVDLCEIEREGLSYSIDTILHIKQKYKITDRLGLLMGYDTFLTLPSWYRVEDILDETVIIVARRDVTDDMQLPAELQGRLHCIMLDNDCIDISSTQIRQKKSMGMSHADDMPQSAYDIWQNISLD